MIKDFVLRSFRRTFPPSSMREEGNKIKNTEEMERFFMGIDLKKHVYEQSWEEKKRKKELGTENRGNRGYTLALTTM